MAGKREVLERLERFLVSEGFAVCRFRGCFDLAAKRGEIFLFKVLFDLGSLSREHAKNLKILSGALSAYPFAIGVVSKGERLLDGVIYERFGIPSVSLETVKKIISEGSVPAVYRDRGGFFVEIDPELLRAARKRHGISRSELASMLGLSKKAVYHHERTSSRMLLGTAMLLEELFGRVCAEFRPRIFEESGSPKDEFERRTASELERLGFETNFASFAPFDVVATDRVTVLSEVEASASRLRKRAEIFRRFIAFTGKPGFIVSEKKPRESSVPVILRKELKKFSSGTELIETIS